MYGDKRGSFAEILKYSSSTDLWLSDLSWIKQINRSKSKGNVFRGCHAQKAPFCQGKLVQAVTGKIFDIITDARPDSATFGSTQAFLLDSEKQNMLWVPRGFLHAFAVVDCEDEVIFEYFCDNVYDKASEIEISPLSFLPQIYSDTLENIESFKQDETTKILSKFFKNTENLNLSDKDLAGKNYTAWMNEQKEMYYRTNTLWYK